MSDIVKFGLMADCQGSDQPDDPDWNFIGSPDEYRRFTTAAARLQQAVDTFNSESVDLVIDVGDLIDLNLSVAEIRSYLQARMAQYGDLTMPYIGTVGNHEWILYDTSQKIADYYTDIDTVHAARSNIYTDSNEWKSFTYDLGGIRFISLVDYMVESDAGLFTWLEAQLAVSDLPVVIICHVPIWPIAQWQWTYANDYQTFQDVIDAAGNVQAVLCGHYHWDNGDVVINDVPYYSFFGSVLCPNVDDNAYFILEIIPNAVGTPNGMKANIKITGYGSNGVAKTVDYKSYGVFS
jgi:hypothetical protein